MNATSDPITVQLTGALPAILIAGAVIAYPASVGLLWFYRRAVLRAMSEEAGGGTTLASAPTPPAPLPQKALDFVMLGPTSTFDTAQFRPWRAAWVYLAAGAAFAAVMTAAWLLATRDAAISPNKLAALFWPYLWPTVLAVGLVAATDRATWLRLIGAYVLVFIALGAVSLARSPDLTVGQLAQYWMITNVPPTVLMLLFLARRIRAVGPMVLVFGVLALLGAHLAIGFVGAADSRMRAAVRAAGALGLGGTGAFWGIATIGLALFALIGWVALRWLGKRYEQKRLSDESLKLDALFLLFGINYSMGLVFEHWAWIASGFVAFFAYKLVAASGFRKLVPPQRPQRLLLLRVFALGRRSERLFDALRKRWSRGGSIAMIAGPDLATTAVEPHEFLGFLAGKLGRAFVSGSQDLDRRVAAIDRKPDPDGRFRVAEFFCRADTWQPTMQRLVRESDAVMMDLRSFSPSNQGCVYELGRLLDAIDLARVVFVIDATTDRAFLEASLSRLWQTMSADSPNRRSAEPAARLFEIRGPTAGETRALVGHLAVA